MQEYSRIIIEDYCMTHPKTKKSQILWELVHMSYNVNQLYVMYYNQKYYLMGHFIQWKLMQRKLYNWILEYLSIMSMLFLRINVYNAYMCNILTIHNH